MGAVNEAGEGQLSLVSARGRATTRASRAKAPSLLPAPVDPVGEVIVDVPLAHLDRVFDYEIPASMHDVAVPGVRVRVRFAGTLVDGWLVARRGTSAHEGKLKPLAKVVSSEPVLAPEILTLARAVADRYAGTVIDVLRTAIPPRHARVEDEPRVAVVADAVPSPADPGPWRAYSGGAALVRRLAEPDPVGPRAAWTAIPGEDPAFAIAVLAQATLAAGRGVVVVVPDGRDVRAFDEAFVRVLGPNQHVTLTAAMGAASRYRAWLSLRRGDVAAVIGTRATAFAPVREPGLLVVWDDGDDVHVEPHAPGWSVREVLALRAHLTGAALVIGGWSRSVATEALVERGWAREVVATRAEVRRRSPRVIVSGDDIAAERDPAARSARLPSVALTAVREALAGGPVLVQVPRAGYLPALACQSCRTVARCRDCSGPLLASSGHAIAACARCGRLAGDWACEVCSGRHLRAAVTGSARTAEEFGRSFPGVPVIESSGGRMRDAVDARPRIVVATPGAEPPADGGYCAALLLDARMMLDRPTLRAGEEALRRWTAAVALVRPASAGGRVVIVGEPDSPAVQALVRNDPAGFAARELRERTAAGLPPAVRSASLVGTHADVTAYLDAIAHSPGMPDVRVLGPVPIGDNLERALLTTGREESAGFLAGLSAVAASRSARRDGAPVAVRVDPFDID